MIPPEMTTALCEALFASSLQGSEGVTADVAAAAISRAVERLGPAGCACRMAQEFGDHPEEARARMQWARRILSEISLTATQLPGGVAWAA